MGTWRVQIRKWLLLGFINMIEMLSKKAAQNSHSLGGALPQRRTTNVYIKMTINLLMTKMIDGKKYTLF